MLPPTWSRLSRSASPMSIPRSVGAMLLFLFDRLVLTIVSNRLPNRIFCWCCTEGKRSRSVRGVYHVQIFWDRNCRTGNSRQSQECEFFLTPFLWSLPDLTCSISRLVLHNSIFTLFTILLSVTVQLGRSLKQFRKRD